MSGTHKPRVSPSIHKIPNAQTSDASLNLYDEITSGEHHSTGSASVHKGKHKTREHTMAKTFKFHNLYETHTTMMKRKTGTREEGDAEQDVHPVTCFAL